MDMKEESERLHSLTMLNSSTHDVFPPIVNFDKKKKNFFQN